MTSNAMRAIVGNSAPMQRLRALIEAAAPTKLSVLIEGPTGAGKELVAAALHELSGREGNLVAFNVTAIGDSMFEDALFGHVRGAFTGAVSDSAGFLREANRGTAFFDEISGLPAMLQVKLLRAIETGRFRPVGARCDASSDFRIVAATNECPEALLESRTFRLDLMHRVAAVRIAVPGLQQRLEDVPSLVMSFLRGTGRPSLDVTPAAMRAFQERPWPGNVRELKHVVHWAATLATDAIDEHVLRRISEFDERPSLVSVDAGGQERLRIRDALERHSWDTERAASELGVNRATLYRWIRKFQLSGPGRMTPRARSTADGPRAVAS
jgi:transcriptional regulator with PAS, ATPase and Fis domain